MKIELERQGNYVAANVKFADFKTKGKGRNWQEALLDGLGRVEVEMVLRLYQKGILLPEEGALEVKDAPVVKDGDRLPEHRWYGLELLNGQVVGEAPRKVGEEGQVPCGVCGVPTWGTLCGCCCNFAAVEWEKRRIIFRTPKRDGWTKVDTR